RLSSDRPNRTLAAQFEGFLEFGPSTAGDPGRADAPRGAVRGGPPRPSVANGRYPHTGRTPQLSGRDGSRRLCPDVGSGREKARSHLGAAVPRAGRAGPSRAGGRANAFPRPSGAGRTAGRLWFSRHFRCSLRNPSPPCGGGAAQVASIATA